MKIRINEEGNLKIYRGSDWKDQFCPLADYEFCGGWCPLFGEPYEKTVSVQGDEGEWINAVGVALQICQGRIFECVPEDFDDQR